MERITNNVLAEKIDNLHTTLNEIKPEIKANSEFRFKAKGALGILTFSAGIIGGAVAFIFNKFFGD